MSAEFVRAEIGWELPEKMRKYVYEQDNDNYKPAIDSKTLVSTVLHCRLFTLLLRSFRSAFSLVVMYYYIG